MFRYFFWGVLVLAVSVVMIAGFRGQKFEKPPIQIIPDMKQQGKYKAQAESNFFADGRADRQLVPGTIPAQVDVKNPYRETGIIDGFYGDGIPLTVSESLLARGQERYNINCAACHGALGDGKGITSKYGMAGAANYHSDRIRQMPDGEIFHTITDGKGNMIGLPNIPADDRWAIIAYIRVLQRSQHATLNDVPEQQRSELSK
ncbi:MAG: cytochrome c [Verrucomicrobiales bacterium]|jgi:mono/diheme cytochrome c family protein|nr:cytochrome c [Verrucomicrobiales bacterium]